MISPLPVTIRPDGKSEAFALNGINRVGLTAIFPTGSTAGSYKLTCSPERDPQFTGTWADIMIDASTVLGITWTAANKAEVSVAVDCAIGFVRVEEITPSAGTKPRIYLTVEPQR